jgi:hypothetical protein
MGGSPRRAHPQTPGLEHRVPSSAHDGSRPAIPTEEQPSLGNKPLLACLSGQDSGHLLLGAPTSSRTHISMNSMHISMNSMHISMNSMHSSTNSINSSTNSMNSSTNSYCVLRSFSQFGRPVGRRAAVQMGVGVVYEVVLGRLAGFSPVSSFQAFWLLITSTACALFR